ncbi:MAG: hydrogenase nickel incorporation protein HypB [Deltaproteobacteria bacterium]|nr:hydrogenase nickel incorporation protein HypB [Deltaproteobacteria bacterium]
MKVSVVRNILEANEAIAQKNRKLFKEKGIFTINLMSSPGAGKTTLLENTVEALKDKLRMAVIEGDIQSSVDARRIARKGVRAIQINTDGGCHLDANMIQNVLAHLDLDNLDLLIIENVGNLVCPAEFDIGENVKTMILSVTEGDDKPLKYPVMFRESAVLLINKIDLLPYTNCKINNIKKAVLKLNPKIKIFEVSCRTGEGLENWYKWIRQQTKKK